MRSIKPHDGIPECQIEYGRLKLLARQMSQERKRRPVVTLPKSHHQLVLCLPGTDILHFLLQRSEQGRASNLISKLSQALGCRPAMR